MKGFFFFKLFSTHFVPTLDELTWKPNGKEKEGVKVREARETKDEKKKLASKIIFIQLHIRSWVDDITYADTCHMYLMPTYLHVESISFFLCDCFFLSFLFCFLFVLWPLALLLLFYFYFSELYIMQSNKQSTNLYRMWTEKCPKECNQRQEDRKIERG